MNTRTFLKSLATIAVAPSILIPRAPDAYRWKHTIAVLNPAWVDAEYECFFATFEPMPPFIANCATFANGLWVHQRKSDTDKIDHSMPTRRYVLNKGTNIFERVE